MPYQIIIKRSAEKELNALSTALRDRIANRLLALEENPRPVGIKKLQGEESYRMRMTFPQRTLKRTFTACHPLIRFAQTPAEESAHRRK